MAGEGADLLDIGGQSTRPGSEPVSVGQELDRVIPLVRRLRGAQPLPLPLSIDTNRATVAEAALEAGADIINDISGLRDDPEIARVVAKYDAGLVLMHIQGTPNTMQQSPHYENLLGEVIDYLSGGIARALERGVSRESIWVDPGIGFGKTIASQPRAVEKAWRAESVGLSYPGGNLAQGLYRQDSRASPWR